MAIRTITTHWGLAPVDSSTVTSGNTRTFSATTIYSPENSDRTFKAAIVEMCFSGLETSGTDITAVVAGLTVNATRTTVTPSGTLSNSIENQGGVLVFDFTSNVESNFGTGTSQSFQFDVTITGVDTNNVSASLALTYEYDETDTTRCKTVMYPAYGLTGALNTSSGSYGNIIPIITGTFGILKEDTITIRDYYFVLEGNENGNGGTTDFALNVRLDSDSYDTFGTIERALGSDKHYRYIWSKKGAVPDTTALHSFSAYCTTQSHHCMSIMLVITYEFDESATTSAYNSFQIPFRVGEPGGTASGDVMIARIPIDVQEPNPAYFTGAVKLYCVPIGSITASNVMRVTIGSGGGEGETQFTNSIATGSIAGTLVILKKFNSSDFTFARGKCYIDVKVYMSSDYGIYNFSGIAYINYRSDIATIGIGAHNHTIYYPHTNVSFTAAAPYVEYSAQALAPIIETYWWMHGFGVWCWRHHVGASTGYFAHLYAEVLSGEGLGEIGDGWVPIFIDTYTPASKTGSRGTAELTLDVFQQHPDDPRIGRLVLSASRKLRMYSPRWTGGFFFMIPYHSITYTVSGTVSGYTGDGDVDVNIHDATTGEWLYTETAAVGGDYTLEVYDDTRDHFSQVYEDATHVGRSANWKA